jgi:hypothetical protein
MRLYYCNAEGLVRCCTTDHRRLQAADFCAVRWPTDVVVLRLIE